MRRIPLGFKVGAALAAFHLCLAALAFLTTLGSHCSTSALVYVWFFVPDAPLLMLPSSAFRQFGVAAPLIQFGVLGSALWLLIPWLTDKAVQGVLPRATNMLRGLVIGAAVLLVLFGFAGLESYVVTSSIQSERPAELKKMLNQASSDFLTARVVYRERRWSGVSAITRMRCRAGADEETLLSLPWGVLFLDERYQEKHRLSFAAPPYETIEPLAAHDVPSCQYLGYKLSESVHLLGSDGQELWRSAARHDGGVPLEGTLGGDIDGDGRPELVVYYSYRRGLEVFGSEGHLRWSCPVYSLGHVEIADVRDTGRPEVIYSNSNNATGSTNFTFLNSEGAIAKQMKVATLSSEFAPVRWPKDAAQSLLVLTEDGRLRLVDSEGNTVQQLPAPGCRTFGAVRAVAVKFRRDQPEYLAVRKCLHPDLLVLYVYDAAGALVYQKTEVAEGAPTPTLAAVPSGQTGSDNLLAGSERDSATVIEEYSLTRR